VAEAYLGPDSVSWNQATQTVTITFNGADVAARAGASANMDLSGIVQPGTFSIDLVHVDGGLIVANGPAAGTRLVVSFINDRHMIPATMFPRALPVDAAAMYAEVNLASGLLQMAIQALTGRSFTYSVAPGGVTITLGDAVTLPNLTFVPPVTTPVTLPAEIPPVAQEPAAPAGRFTPGTFTGTSYNTYSHRPDNEGGLTPTPLVVEIVVDADNILSARVASHGESSGWLRDYGAAGMASANVAYIVTNQRASVDTIAMATYTTRAINEAAAAAIAAAEGR
jgi:uncharacterized protein with FMN-binding domain